MQDTSRLEIALRNAHAAGDAAAARRLAQEIQRVRSEGEAGRSSTVGPADPPRSQGNDIIARSHRYYERGAAVDTPTRPNIIPDLGMNTRNLMQGLNLGDEAAGLEARISNVFTAPENRVDPAIVSERERERVETMRRDHPGRAMAAEVMGGMPLAAAGPGAQPLASAARPMLTAAAGGATYGGIAGAGHGETLEGRLGEGAAGAGVGAVLGPVTAKALGLLGAGARTLGRQFGPRRVQAPQANSGAVNLARRSGVMDEITADPQALGASDGSFVAERFGSQTRTTADGLAGIAGGSQDVAEAAIGARAAGRADRMSQATGAATGLEPGQRPIDPLLRIDELRATARPMFDQADAEMIRISPEMRETIRRAHEAGGQQLFSVADQLGSQSAGGVRLSTFADDIDGLPERMPLGVLRSLARAIEAEASGAARSDSARSALTPRLQDMARQIRGGMGRQSPNYREAARIWSSSARDDEAMTIGEGIFGPSLRNERELNRFATSGLSESERRHFFAGVAAAMERRMGNVGQGGNAAATLDRALIRRRLNQFLGPEASDELMARINSEIRQSRFESRVNRSIGSATSSREQSVQHVRDANISGPQSVLSEILRDPAAFLRGRQGREAMANAVRNGNDEALTELSRVLYSQGDVAQDPLVQAILMEAQRRGVAPWQGAINGQVIRSEFAASRPALESRQ